MTKMKKIIKIENYIVMVYLKEVSVKANKKAMRVFCRCLTNKEIGKLSADFIDFLDKNNCIEV